MQYIPHEEAMYRDIADLNPRYNSSVIVGDDGLGDLGEERQRSFRNVLDVPQFTPSTASSSISQDLDSTISPMTITNYDVLIDGSYEHGFRSMDDEHVGNKRFEVFLNLHRQEYEMAKINQNQGEMEHIVGRIIDIVCHKCVPKGRFLEKFAIRVEGESEWIDLGEGMLARHRVHQALGGDSNQHQYHHHHNNDHGLHDNPMATPSMLWASMSNIPALPSYDLSSSNDNDNNITNPYLPQQVQQQQPGRGHLDEIMDDSSSKRRRRGSYAKLRRSISESMLVQSSNFRTGGGIFDTTNHNNATSTTTALLRPIYSETNHHDNPQHTTIRSTTTTSTTMINITPHAMDVIFIAGNPTELASTTGNPGNARFQVMIDMHTSSFCLGDSAKRRRILAELITTVHVHWKGRFLVQMVSPSGGSRNVTESSPQIICQELTSDAAGSSICSLLLQRGGMWNSSTCTNDDDIMNNNTVPPTTTTTTRKSVSKDRFGLRWLSDRSASLGATTTAPIATGTDTTPTVDVRNPSVRSSGALAFLRKANSLPTVVAKQDPFLVPGMSVSGISTIPSSRPEDTDDMMLRYAAIEDLKSKKKKRDLMARVMTRK